MPPLTRPVLADQKERSREEKLMLAGQVCICENAGRLRIIAPEKMYDLINLSIISDTDKSDPAKS